MGGYVRPLEEEDVAQIADLHLRVIRGVGGPSPASFREYLSEIFLKHPWYDEAFPSLVYQETGGKIVGCMGVMPRPMSFDGQKVIAASSHSFMVEPESRATLAGVKLVKRFLSGPQDLSMTQGNTMTQKICEKFGGSTFFLYSLCWTRPLWPSRYALSFLGRRGLPDSWAWALRPFCRLADAVTPLVQQDPFRLRVPNLKSEELDAGTLCSCFGEVTKDRQLRPEYDGGSSQWLLKMLAENRYRRSLEKVVVRNADEETVGWYLYYRTRGGIGEVVQIGAKENYVEGVLDHLFYHAKQYGVVAVSGQVDPAFFQALSSKHCLFHQDGRSWMLVHSRHPKVLQAIHRGDAFLTRLEGDWWI